MPTESSIVIDFGLTVIIVDAVDNLIVRPTQDLTLKSHKANVWGSCNAVVDQPMQSMAFWFKAWNSVIPGEVFCTE